MPSCDVSLLQLVLVDVSLLLDGGIALARALVQRQRRLVPQQRTAFLLAFFDGRVLFLQGLDELGVVGFVTAMLLEQEFHIGYLSKNQSKNVDAEMQANTYFTALRHATGNFCRTAATGCQMRYSSQQ